MAPLSLVLLICTAPFVARQFGVQGTRHMKVDLSSRSSRSATLTLISQGKAVRPHTDVALRGQSLDEPAARHLAFFGLREFDSVRLSALGEIERASGKGKFMQAFSQSFTLMCAAELFDRTWFVTFICSLNHGAIVTFLASLSALALHSVIAVSFGGSVAFLFPRWSLEAFSAVLLSGFAIIYAWECYKAAPGKDIMKSRRESVAHEVPDMAVANPQEDSSPELAGGDDTGTTSKPAQPPHAWTAAFVAVFTTIFIAEWGDRTQIVQITLAASLPWFPVLLGSFSGLILLCLSATALARVMEGWEVNERAINLVCAVSFAVMAVLAMHEARQDFIKAES